MKVAFTDIDQQSVNGRTARAVNRTTGEVHTVTIAGGEADFGQLTYQQAYEVYGVTASGARVTSVLVKTETNEPGTPSEPPQSAPGGLSATAVSASRINLSWNALSGATSYEYRIDSGSAISVGANTSAEVVGLDADTEYSFQVRGRNDAGAGPWSSVVTATTDSGVTITESFDKVDGPGIAHDLNWTFVAGESQEANTTNGEANFPQPPSRFSIRADDPLASENQYAQFDVLEHGHAGRQTSVALGVRGSASSDSYIYFNITNWDENTYRIIRLTDGDRQDLTAIDTDPPSVPYTARVEVEDVGGGQSRIKGIINGTEVINYDYPSSDHANRHVFLRVSGGRDVNGGVRLDNFAAGDL